MTTVALVGKPNVGKSTIFNRLVGRRRNIVDDTPGVTRDVITAEVRTDEGSFRLMDTCGIFDLPENQIEEKMRNLTLSVLEEADVVVFVVDGRNGITPQDEDIALLVKKAGVPTILVANKTENRSKFESEVLPEVYKLGLGDPIPVSAEHNLGLNELLDAIKQKIKEAGLNLEEQIEKSEETMKICIVGRPNVGKSSLFNAMMGMERALVTDIPGTTRDMVEEKLQIDGKEYIFVDTAGLRRPSRVEMKTVESYSNLRTVRAIEASDVVIILLDATQGITHQDQRIAGLVKRRYRASVVVFNKWDAVETKDEKAYISLFERELYFLDYSPLIFASATKKTGLNDIFDALDTAYESYTRRYPTNRVNQAIRRFLEITPMPSKGGKKLKLYYITQVDIKPPTFVVFCNDRKLIKKSFERRLEKAIRHYLDPFPGSPLLFKFKERGE